MLSFLKNEGGIYINICLEAVEWSNKFERSNFEDNNIKKNAHKKRILILLMKLCSLQQDIEDYLELASILCTR